MTVVGSGFGVADQLPGLAIDHGAGVTHRRPRLVVDGADGPDHGSVLGQDDREPHPGLPAGTDHVAGAWPSRGPYRRPDVTIAPSGRPTCPRTSAQTAPTTPEHRAWQAAPHWVLPPPRRSTAQTADHAADGSDTAAFLEARAERFAVATGGAAGVTGHEAAGCSSRFFAAATASPDPVSVVVEPKGDGGGGSAPADPSFVFLLGVAWSGARTAPAEPRTA